MTGFIECTAVGPWWIEALVFVLAGTALVLAWLGARHEQMGLRWSVVALRTLIIATAVFLLHQPTWVQTVAQSQARKIAVLVDQSGSMQLAQPDGATRYDLARAWVNGFAPEDLDWQVHTFDHTVSAALPKTLPESPNAGNRTDFFQSLTQFLSSTPALAGIVLLSDGHDLSAFTTMDLERSKNWLNRLHAPPINAIMVGAASEGPDVAIHSIEAPAFSYVRAPLTFRATILARGIGHFDAQIQLQEDGKLVQARDVSLDAQGFGTVEFTIYPETVGEHLYQVVAPRQPLEFNKANNAQYLLVQIGRDKISVLHIAGSVNWDLQALRELLETEPQIDLTAFYIMRTREHLQRGVDGRPIPPDEMALVPFPAEEIFDRQLFGFDVVIFQDFDAGNYFSDSYQARRLMGKIREFVQVHHGGLVVVAGPQMAAGPSFSLTPLSEILPLLPPTHRTTYAEDWRTATATQDGRYHPILAGITVENLPILGCMDGVTPHANATILMHDESGAPLLATLKEATGRTVFLNTASSWEWRHDALARGQTGKEFYAFWNQVLKWVTADPSMHEVRMTCTKSSQRPLDLDVSLLLRNANYAPAGGISTQIDLRPVGQSQSAVTKRFETDSEGHAQVKFHAPSPGYYEVALTQLPWSDRCRPQIVFLGGSQDEFRNTEPARETLDRLASLTGGAYFSSPDHVDPDDLILRSEPQKQTLEVRRLKLQNWIWFLPLIILLAGAEWTLRRRSHLP